MSADVHLVTRSLAVEVANRAFDRIGIPPVEDVHHRVVHKAHVPGVNEHVLRVLGTGEVPFDIVVTDPRVELREKD